MYLFTTYKQISPRLPIFTHSSPHGQTFILLILELFAPPPKVLTCPPHPLFPFSHLHVEPPHRSLRRAPRPSCPTTCLAPPPYPDSSCPRTGRRNRPTTLAILQIGKSPCRVRHPSRIKTRSPNMGPTHPRLPWPTRHRARHPRVRRRCLFEKRFPASFQPLREIYPRLPHPSPSFRRTLRSSQSTLRRWRPSRRPNSLPPHHDHSTHRPLSIGFRRRPRPNPNSGKSTRSSSPSSERNHRRQYWQRLYS